MNDFCIIFITMTLSLKPVILMTSTCRTGEVPHSLSPQSECRLSRNHSSARNSYCIFSLFFSKTGMIRTLTLALGSIIVGVEQFELSSSSSSSCFCFWFKRPTISSSFSTSFFFSKLKWDCLTGDTEPRRGKDKVGRECRLCKH